MSEEEASAPSVFERILAYSSLSIIAVALLSYFATIIVGMSNGPLMAEGFWPFIYGFSLIGLPVGFVLLILLLIVSGRRRKADFRRSAGK